jgi:hypothetical protein
VQGLLGHCWFALPLQYTRLVPDQRREAVAKLNEKPLVSLTLRLQGIKDPIAPFYPIDFMVVREGLGGNA